LQRQLCLWGFVGGFDNFLQRHLCFWLGAFLASWRVVFRNRTTHRQNAPAGGLRALWNVTTRGVSMSWWFSKAIFEKHKAVSVAFGINFLSQK
jgi:hypothetical protein